MHSNLFHFTFALSKQLFTNHKTLSKMTTHKFNINGFDFAVQPDGMVLNNTLRGEGTWGMGGKQFSLREKVQMLIDGMVKSVKDKEQKDYMMSLSISEVLSHKDFAYARYKTGFGGYYDLYFRDSTSPTGVTLVRGCSIEEWETSSKETNQSHNYLAPNEKY